MDNKLSERLFEALLVELIVSIIGLISNNNFTRTLLIGTSTIIAATIAFIPRYVNRIQIKAASTTQENITSRFSSFPMFLSTWFQWIAISAVNSVIFLIGIGTLLNIQSNIIFVIAGAVSALVSGILQWLIIRKFFSNASQWIITTTLGTMLGEFLISLSPLNALGYHSPLQVGVISGLTVGISQWFILRKHFPNMWLWVIAYVMNLVIVLPMNNSFQAMSSFLINGNLVDFFATFLSGGSSGVLTGLLLAFVSRKKAS